MRSITASSLFSLLSLGCTKPASVVISPVSYTNTSKTTAAIVEAPIAQQTPLLSQEFAMVIQQQDRMLLVLDSSPEASLSTTEPLLMSRHENEAVLKKLLDSAEPSIKGWVGQKVALYGEGKQRCEASVKDVYLQGNIFIDADDYPFGQDLAVEPMTDTEFAKKAWESGRVLLVAELKDTARCEGATFGRLPSQGKPVLTTMEDAPTALSELALQEFRKLPQYQEIQAEYSEYPYAGFEEDATRSATWEGYSDTAPKVSLIQASNHRQLVSVSVDVWGGCGDFNGNLFALFDMNVDQSLHLIATSTQGINPQEILDVQGDGDFEIIQGEEWYERQNDQYQTAASLYIPWDMPICNC